MKKLLGLFCVMLLFFVLAGPAGATGNRHHHGKKWKGEIHQVRVDRHQDNCYSPVPEPGTMLLLGTGIFGLAMYGRKKFKK